MHQPANIPSIQVSRDDIQLLEAFSRKGDQAAFHELVNRHARWVFAAAYRQLGDGALAEDAVQVVFILLAQRAHDMNARQKISGWLFRTLQYTVKNLQRGRRHRAKYEQSAAYEAAERAKDAAPSAEDIRELAAVLDPAVARLPEVYRTAILLRFYQDMPFDQVAQAMAINEGAARKRVERALGLLRKHVGSSPGTSLLSASAALGAEQISSTLVQKTAGLALAAKAGTLPASTAVLVKGVSTMMFISKVQTAVLATAAGLAVLVPATLAVQAMSRPTPPAAAAASAPRPLQSATYSGDGEWLPPWRATTAEEKDFVAKYGLAKDELIKHVPPPFAPWRKAILDRFTADGAAAYQKYLIARAQAYAASAQAGAAGGGAVMTGGGAGVNPTATPATPTRAGGGGFVASGGGGGGGGGARAGVRGTGAGANVTNSGAAFGGPASDEPGAVVLGWRDGRMPQIRGVLFRAGSSYSVATLMQGLFMVSGKELEGATALLQSELPGDFVVRNGADPEKLCAGAEKMLSKELGAPVSVKFREVDVPAYVLRGKWTYTPVAGQAAPPAGGPQVIHIYSTDMSRTLGNGSGEGAGLAGMLGRSLDAYVKMEAENLPRDVRFYMHDPMGRSDPQAVLDHITEQTGLKWSQETQKVKHLVVDWAQ